MAKLAMVIPAIRSDLNNFKVYFGAHSNTGKKYCMADITLLDPVSFLNWRKGSSGKNVSFRFAWNVSRNGRAGGTGTRYGLSLSVIAGSAFPIFDTTRDG
jgi:hypothetical protein